MYRFILWDRRDTIVSFKDCKSFEDTLKHINLELEEYKHVILSGAYIYEYLNPEVNQSMKMIASLRVIR